MTATKAPQEHGSDQRNASIDDRLASMNDSMDDCDTSNASTSSKSTPEGTTVRLHLCFSCRDPIPANGA
ncbi:hypothetical protein ON010_g3444 [Phytophthora cinnamomi]|nr:hypothetical protein ON010_g3444 [Phytophthora cinnamomi]